MFAHRRSATGVIEFLRLLRSKIPAYEPFYLSGQYSGAVEISSSRTTQPKQRGQSEPIYQNPPQTGPTRRATGTSQSLSNSMTYQESELSVSSPPKKSAMRRPSMMKSEQLLKQ